jgi:hypothetical protein
MRYGRDVHGNNYLPGAIVHRAPLKPLSSPLTVCDRRTAPSQPLRRAFTTAAPCLHNRRTVPSQPPRRAFTTAAPCLHNRRTAAGFVGLNNLKHTDYVNVVLHALAHVGPIRDFFLQVRPI